MTKKDIEQKTFMYFHSGFNCAESILKSFVELYNKEPDPGITKFASGFGGGIGGSHCETCGALTGGIIALAAYSDGRIRVMINKRCIHCRLISGISFLKNSIQQIVIKF
jgi:C_GCAxxG_C_C family probable redox protein